jgi:serine/threonine-protein kinase
MVLVFSSHANDSPQIRREVQLAVSAETVLIPFRIEDVAPTRSLEYFLGAPHWLDAMTAPLEAHLERLAAAVTSFLGVSEPAESTAAPAHADVPRMAHQPQTAEPLRPPPDDQSVQAGTGDPTLPAIQPPDVGQPAYLADLSREPEKAIPYPPTPAPQNLLREVRVRRVSRRTKIAVVAGPLVFVAALAAAVGIPAIVKSPTSTTSPPTHSSQVTLPFIGLNQPSSVAVDTVAASVYVTDRLNNRVLKLAAGSPAPTGLPFTGLDFPEGVAVDPTGALYVADDHNKRVLMLAAGATTPSVLPFTGLGGAMFVAVDTFGSVYVTDPENNQVLQLEPGAPTPTVLPFTGLNTPLGLAVDGPDVYVVDKGNNRVLKLELIPHTQTVLPFTGLDFPTGAAIDTEGNVYVADSGNNRVLKMEGRSTPTVLPFTGLNAPMGVAIDTEGNVYVADSGNRRVVKLPAR